MKMKQALCGSIQQKRQTRNSERCGECRARTAKHINEDLSCRNLGVKSKMPAESRVFTVAMIASVNRGQKENRVSNESGLEMNREKYYIQMEAGEKPFSRINV